MGKMEKIKETKELLTIKSCGCMERDGILYPVSRIAKGEPKKGQGGGINPQTLLSVARADSIPEGWSGLWFVRKFNLHLNTPTERYGQPVIVPAGTYTMLFRMTDSTIHCEPPGEAVMEDTPYELHTHIQFMMQAHGDVLVTGLGLGCVVRGLLANPAVHHITCIEKSSDVLKLVQPHMPQGRLTIVHADALEWTKKNKQPFDCAWHDLWTNRDEGEPHLDIWHMRLLLNCRSFVCKQGAWAFNRDFRRLMRQKGMNLI